MEKSRFVKCFKYKVNFYVWEDVDENGNTVRTSTCPYVYQNQSRIHCNGLNHHGIPCSYASLPQNHKLTGDS